jgi:hypothetical protein
MLNVNVVVAPGATADERVRTVLNQRLGGESTLENTCPGVTQDCEPVLRTTSVTNAVAPDAMVVGTVLRVGSYAHLQKGVVADDTFTDTFRVGPKKDPSGDIIRAPKVDVPTVAGAVMTNEKVVVLPVVTVEVRKTLDHPNEVPTVRRRYEVFQSFVPGVVPVFWTTTCTARFSPGAITVGTVLEMNAALLPAGARAALDAPTDSLPSQPAARRTMKHAATAAIRRRSMQMLPREDG